MDLDDLEELVDDIHDYIYGMRHIIKTETQAGTGTAFTKHQNIGKLAVLEAIENIIGDKINL